MKDADTILKYLRRLFPGVRFVHSMADLGHINQLSWERDGRRNAVRWGRNVLVSPMDIARKVLPHAYPGTVIHA